MSTYYTIMSMIDGFKSFINLAVMVLTIIASWIMYAKAGEHGWAAIVPFYSSYVKFRIAGKQKLFWGYLVASIASIAGCILLMYEIIASGLSVMTSSYMGSYYDSTYGYAGNRIGAHMGMLIFAVILIIAAMIAALVMNILCCVGLAPRDLPAILPVTVHEKILVRQVPHPLQTVPQLLKDLLRGTLSGVLLPPGIFRGRFPAG